MRHDFPTPESPITITLKRTSCGVSKFGSYLTCSEAIVESRCAKDDKNASSF